MRKLKLALPVLLLAVLVLIGGGCLGGKYSTPTKTIQTLFKAMEAKDQEAYLDCFSEGTLKLFEQSGQEINMETVSRGIPEEIPEIKVVEKKDGRAVVRAEVEGSAPMVLIKEKSGWKIDLEATMQLQAQQYQSQ